MVVVISPLVALLLDILFTFITQAGLINMKLAHHEADAKNAKMREFDTQRSYSGF